MSDVYPFQPTPLRPEIRISAGTVLACTDPRDVGRFMYFLTFVEPDGGELCVWDGYAREDALAAARYWQRDGGVLFDETVPVIQ